MIQLCLRLKITACSAKDALASAMSFIIRYASSDDTAIGITHTNAGYCSQICLVAPFVSCTVCGSPPNQPKMPTEITSGTMNCTDETPRFPRPALSPSAEPLRSFGKKKLMLAIDELKLPPPSPHSAASTSITQ